MTRPTIWLAIMCLLTVVFFAAALTQGRAHEAPTGWRYDYRCCSNRDCNMLKADRVKEGPDGYEITLYPGDHNFIKDKPVSFLIPYDDRRIKDSPDGAPHLCINTALRVLCFYRPPSLW